MQTIQDIKQAITDGKLETTSLMLHALIDQNELERAGTEKKMHLRYLQEKGGVPVLNKTFARHEKVEVRLPNDFFGDIIDVKTGYLGNEISIEVSEKLAGEKAVAQNTFLQDWAKKNRTADKNSELVKGAAMCGRWFRLLYASKPGDARIMNMPAWECVVYRDAGTDEIVYGMRYYRMTEVTTGVSKGAGASREQEKSHYRVEWYDDTSLTKYEENSDGEFVEMEPPMRHLFKGVPLLEFRNNEEGMSEASSALDLIDAYDDILSDATSEVEQLRMAYMFLKGTGLAINAAFMENVRQTGVFPLTDAGEIGFASKDLNSAGGFITSLLAEIRKNIYAFAKSIDLSEDRGGDMRVIGWQIALLRMEMSSQVTERKFKDSYLRQYELLTQYWGKVQNTAQIDPYSLHFTFTRKFPKDVAQEVLTLVDAIAVLPLETAYGLMSFIDDPKELADKWREEQLATIPNVDAFPPPDETPNEPPQDEE